MAKGNIEPSFREFLKLLNARSVRYLVLGGYAVNFYGYQRYTKDLDVWVAIDSENCHRLSAALQEFGGFSSSQVSPQRLAEPGAVFMMGREPIRIDLINEANGVAFGECWVRRNEVEIDGIRVPMIGLDDLRANKLASARPQDVADVSKLPSVWPAPKKLTPRSQRPR